MQDDVYNRMALYARMQRQAEDPRNVQRLEQGLRSRTFQLLAAQVQNPNFQARLQQELYRYGELKTATGIDIQLNSVWESVCVYVRVRPSSHRTSSKLSHVSHTPTAKPVGMKTWKPESKTLAT